MKKLSAVVLLALAANVAAAAEASKQQPTQPAAEAKATAEAPKEVAVDPKAAPAKAN